MHREKELRITLFDTILKHFRLFHVVIFILPQTKCNALSSSLNEFETRLRWRHEVSSMAKRPKGCWFEPTRKYFSDKPCLVDNKKEKSN